MTLTAREAMQALLDGKTLIGNTHSCWKISDEGELQMRWEARENWICAGVIWNGDCKIQEEYSLTFEEAVRAMLDGKVVECDPTISSPLRFHDGEFQFLDCVGEWIQANWFKNELQKAKWKVVE